MNVPIIRVEDWALSPPVVTKYSCGDNELDFRSVYIKIKILPKHPGRGSMKTVSQPDGQSFILKQCDQAFLDTFWDCAGFLSDYFADFVIHDNAATQGLWFHLLDVLKEAAKLPHEFWQNTRPTCDHSRQFSQNYALTLEMINGVMTGLRQKRTSRLVYLNEGLITRSSVNVGGYKSGIKPWQQFLFNESPGFTVPSESRVHLQEVLQVDNKVREQHIPMGALAIIQKHTDRIRSLTVKVTEESCTADDSLKEVGEALSEFEQNRPKIGYSYAYRSREGRDTVVQQMHPSRFSEMTPKRDDGFSDPSDLVPNPNFKQLDEAVGRLRGVQPFTHPRGNGEFQMWSVSSSGICHRTQEVEETARMDSSEMFDDWKL
ncbi:hypothetical protein K469DRAFT_35345 [Zopfia rhizophila CBS 207.26]|uniref:Uncharacterized protein n=1 Tax=Zopfia rhizophila CBS 207.26 TaxID=1314779 RepID=A0A6A6DAW3_9PEZI|nr:hypothetical protein K469DRAFT_35345 [Zopfia rhizophila CBS 207.26]